MIAQLLIVATKNSRLEDSSQSLSFCVILGSFLISGAKNFEMLFPIAI